MTDKKTQEELEQIERELWGIDEGDDGGGDPRLTQEHKDKLLKRKQQLEQLKPAAGPWRPGSEEPPESGFDYLYLCWDFEGEKRLCHWSGSSWIEDIYGQFEDVSTDITHWAPINPPDSGD